MDPQVTASGVSHPDHTKIVATIGPASDGRIGELIDAGMNIARLNFSHGSLEDHKRRAESVRKEAEARSVSVGILADLQGPKMRLGRFEPGGRLLQEGERVLVRQGEGVSEPGVVNFNFGGFLDRVLPGHRLILADGVAELVAEETRGDSLHARVLRTGPISDRKGVHLPDSDIEYLLPTDEDRRHLEFCKEIDVDLFGISFVGTGDELREIRSLAPGVGLVAKIERKLAIENLEDIISASDGIMVARGDLGVELDLEQVPIQQKEMIADAQLGGAFTITATEMLESMIDSSRPTRAEVADVANAILDGTDAIMLSAETAVGDYPVAAVATMRRIARAIESSERYRERKRPAWRASEPDSANALALAAVQISDSLELNKIVCFTETGRTARLLTGYRGMAEIIALSPNLPAVRQMAVLSGCRPIHFHREPSLEDMIYMGSEVLVVRGLADYGETVLFVAGVPPGVARSTNVIKVHRIGEEVRLH